jgi:hypothetical protein
MSDFTLIRPVAVTDAGSFTRASTGTYFDSAGVMQTAAIDEPRFDHDPETLAPRGLLDEDEGSNRFTYSEDFTQAAWQKNGAGSISGTTISPTGAATANIFVEDSSVGVHSVQQTKTITAGATLVFSVFVKPTSGNRWLRLQVGSDGGVNGFRWLFNPSTGASALAAAAFGTGTVGAPTIQALPSGWYRISVSGTVDPAATSVSFTCFYQDEGVTYSASYTGDGVSGSCLFGAQVEEGVAVPSSYIPTNAAPVTRAADVNGAKMLSSVAAPAVATDPDPTAWNAVTAYAEGDRASRSALHKIYQRVIAGTTATAPESDSVNWVEVGPTNRWKMFDAANESQTTNADSIVVVLTPGVVVDSLAFENVDANSIRVQVAGTNYDATIQLKTRACRNWWDYFFEPFVYKTAAVFQGLPLLVGGVITIIIEKTGGIAKCGTCVPGLAKVIGGVEFGASAGIIDYSTKSTDAFGNTTVVERAYSKRVDVTLEIASDKVDEVHRLLASYRARPVVWVGAGNLYSSLIVYGYYRAFAIVIAYPKKSKCNLEIEGLT